MTTDRDANSQISILFNEDRTDVWITRDISEKVSAVEAVQKKAVEDTELTIAEVNNLKEETFLL